jgi:hypothetical protein
MEMSAYTHTATDSAEKGFRCLGSVAKIFGAVKSEKNIPSLDRNRL